MHVYRFDGDDGLDGLRLHDEPVPSPQRGELLLAIKAVSLNYRDIAIPLGRYVREARKGLVPCSDAAAEVVEVGEGVQTFRPGDRVVSAFHPRWFGGPMPATANSDSYGSGQDGWLAEYKVVSQEAVVGIPAAISDEQASTLPCAGVTAWNALGGPTPVRAGQTVLTLGSGGVSIFALQLAKVFGARVIATTSSPRKAEKLRALGADEVINYRSNPNWGDQVREATGGRGVDRVVEVGGPATIEQSLRAVGVNKEVTLIGFLSQDNPGVDYFLLKGSGATTRSITVGDRADLEDLVRAVATTGLVPVIDDVFDFAQANSAFERLRDGKHVGKLVIRLR
ncbi:zinc-dependent alcohol dehydrogenase family protein [Mycobacterium parmense]|uniref:NADPH:quinone oxidoreductase n=1 Tax=Mycobacterium parmense TaxID=185642 RepID=A0A7I7YNX7_9MYCO|nr:NAD(P)-dependent alcohol dehydrogenase [Mycobacterium parmense]MCV7349789.1 NAD(P)-dependent alcohol dehydrogenase [Mycobacterium parmense]ORW51071.1 alcohol dehydrogenase [Mycobacterium parmense]BBZ43556.1 NADPH:quinone oxidoreductase [Mycobacterium parmense]